MLQEYLEAGRGEHTVLFSTHNVSDMEAVTDYCVIIEQGKVVEKGFVEDLKEKYILIKGEREDLEAARPAMFQVSESKYGFEGICLAKDLDQLAGLSVSKETPSLFQISVAVLKKYTAIA
jgi:ABC-2 type transport system ATP-binding protein